MRVPRCVLLQVSVFNWSPHRTLVVVGFDGSETRDDFPRLALIHLLLAITTRKFNLRWVKVDKLCSRDAQLRSQPQTRERIYTYVVRR